MSIQYIEKHFGKVLSVSDIASYLNVSEKTVRRNYEGLGGLRFSPNGKIIFFEKFFIHSVNQRVNQKSLLAVSSGEIVEDRHNLLV